MGGYIHGLLFGQEGGHHGYCSNKKNTGPCQKVSILPLQRSWIKAKKPISQTKGSIDAVGPCQPLYFFAEVLKTEGAHTKPWTPHIWNQCSYWIQLCFDSLSLSFFCLQSKHRHVGTKHSSASHSHGFVNKCKKALPSVLDALGNTLLPLWFRGHDYIMFHCTSSFPLMNAL